MEIMGSNHISLNPIGIETTKVYMNDKGIIGMTKKLPKGHNIGGGNRQKRRQEFKKNKSD
jgi:hypothetical protein